MERELPILYKRKEDCCGCTACYAICSQQAITMQPDEEGFDYPVIDADKCVRCGMCLKVCPIKAAKYSHCTRSSKMSEKQALNQPK